MSTTLNLVELRTGTTADLPLVDTIMQTAFDPRFGEAWTRSQCLGMMALPGVWLTVASIDGTGAGFALARVIADEAELLLLAVVPTARRRGVGRALLRTVLADGKKLGARRAFLEMRAGNDAMMLYRSNGFSKVGERRGYYRGAQGELFDAVTLVSELN